MTSFDAVEKRRKLLLSSGRIISVTDFGSGSERRGESYCRTISGITRRSSIPRKYGILLYKLSAEFGKGCILELGTSLGVGTMYLASADINAQIHTVEGCPAISEIARENFSACGFDNITVHTGTFSDELKKFEDYGLRPGLVFVDGDHRKERVMEYFEHLICLSDENTVIVFDDIHSSKDMGEAWMQICRDRRVSLSVDIFRMGIVFFRRGLTPSSYVIRY